MHNAMPKATTYTVNTFHLGGGTSSHMREIRLRLLRRRRRFGCCALSAAIGIVVGDSMQKSIQNGGKYIRENSHGTAGC